MIWDAQRATDLIFKPALHGEWWLQRKKAVLSFSFKSQETIMGRPWLDSSPLLPCGIRRGWEGGWHSSGLPRLLSPDRFAMLLVDEPRALLQDFLDRFQSLCQLELQLPSLRPEDVKNMVSSCLAPSLGAFKCPVTMPGTPVLCKP